MLTMNIRNKTNDNFHGAIHPHSHHQLKMSPDSIVDCEATAMMALGIHDRVQPVQREESLEIPDLQTRTPPGTPPSDKEFPSCTGSLVQKTSDRLPSVPKEGPKLPPRSPITKARPRSVSEGETTSCRRRAIFGQYWNQESNHSKCATSRRRSSPTSSPLGPRNDLNTTSATPLPSRVRKRSSSLTIMNTVGMMEPETMDYRMFAPTRDYAEHSPICGRFASVEEAPLPESLPPLPTPLRRFCPEGDAPGCLQGMYPLVTPAPILKQSSYHTGAADNQGDEKNASERNTCYGEGQASFNLTRSWRPDRAVSFDAASSSGSSGSSGSGAVKKGVRFDPRVTVTEFEDPIERSWYHEEELDRLKCETIAVAQEYLLTHPDQAERYNRAVLDPVTGTFRKKALFSLPVLSTIGDDALPSPDHKEYEDLMKSQVKTILIIDPNKAILDLLCKSMHSMFPDARLYRTQSGDEALQLASSMMRQQQQQQQQRGSSIPQPPRGFDIVIVEQRLLQGPIGNCHNNTNNKARSLQSMSERGAASEFVPLNKSNSFSERVRQLKGTETSGSELLRVIQEVEDEVFAEPTTTGCGTECKKSEASMICPNPIPRRALLIGVSMHPDYDAIKLREAGADIVWGKPIPRVGDRLRNHLLNALVNKRRRSLSTTGEHLESSTSPRDAETI